VNIPHRLEYRAPVSPQVPIVFFTLALLLGLFLLILTLAQGGPWAFVVLWMVVMGGIAFGLLSLICFEMVVEDGLVHWQTGFRHGSVPMDQAERVVSLWGGQLWVFEFRGGTKVRVGVMQGHVTFLEQLHEEYPALPLPSTAYARLVDRVRLGGKGRRKGRG
jgi:hypothetical protein